MRWGIIGIGGITNDFALSVARSRSVKISACTSARKTQKVTTKVINFAEKFNIPRALASADELIESNEVDIVYIGARNDMHYTLVKRALDAGKAVLCEKPLTCTIGETRELVEYARKQKLFLAEGFWTRYFPAIRRAQELVREGHIGEVYSIWSDFGVNAVDFARLWIPGCGALSDLGCYTVLIATIFYGCRPESVSSVATKRGGIDSQGVVGMTYPGERVASGIFSGLSHTPCEAVVNGTTGIIRIPMSFHCPNKLEITAVKDRSDREVRIEDYPLPEPPKPYPYTYPNGEGLIYQAEEIDRCVSEGLIESPLMPLEDTLIIAEIMDTINKQQGLQEYSYDFKVLKPALELA